MQSADGDEASPEPAAGAEALCLAHLHDPFLHRRLRAAASPGVCTFGHAGTARRPVVPVRLLARTVLAALADRRSDAAGEWDHDDADKAPANPAEVVGEACRTALDAEVLKSVRDHLDRQYWGEHRVPFVPRAGLLRYSWDSFCRTVVERELDLPDGDQPPGSDRDRLAALMGRIAGTIREAGLIGTVEQGDRIWRGRMRPDRTSPGYRACDIGAAPPDRAAENRMSRAGVPLFYGSADIATAVAEISARDERRPYAAVAAFEVTRSIRVIDLVHIPGLPSLFDHEQAARHDSLVFLQDFAKDLSRPVFYDGRKHRDYRPTQYLTDYFRQSAELDVDGIRFRSAHNGGVNYALFVDATQCLEPDAVDGQGTLRLIEGSERVEDLDRGDVTQAV
ncbi:RES domain-containing protein [Streptomyces canus]|uniref:RES domain-containing protein n=1 Tax=Streptomyces canus TaxID=58343 RepID=UPI00225366FF|nr:RES domain-containing protein [Streptomyces canus]MCX4856005.1 RES domain-containing protein [Streptomyces canus]